jgi:hypothetical protein
MSFTNPSEACYLSAYVVAKTKSFNIKAAPFPFGVHLRSMSFNGI